MIHVMETRTFMSVMFWVNVDRINGNQDLCCFNLSVNIKRF